MHQSIRPTLLTVTKSLSRATSSLAPGHILKGANWNYRILETVKGDSTHASTLLKATVIPHSNTTANTPQWFVTTIASPVSRLPPDLGLIFPSGSRVNAQLFAMRAPEVFLGHACTESSQVWAVGAMLLCWIKPGVLGAWDSLHYLLNESWSMAKIKRLFPGWRIPSPDEVEGHVLKDTVESARGMSEEVEEMKAILPLEEELQNVKIPRQIRDLVRFMLVPDPDKRPSALSVLESAEFLAVEKFTRE